MKRYAIVRVDMIERKDSHDFVCPEHFEGINGRFVCASHYGKKYFPFAHCEDCRYGDTKEQLVRKVAQALLIDAIERYRKAPNCDVNKTIIEHEYRICLEKAQFIVEFLGVE